MIAFPSHCFPRPIKAIIDGLEPIVGSRAEYGGLAALFMGSLVSAETRIRVKEGYELNTNLYCAIVADKGEAKSPAIKFIIGTLLRKFGHEAKEHLKAQEQWEIKVSVAKTLKGEAKNLMLQGLEEGRPKMPWWGMITDGTVEGLRKVAQENAEAGHPSRICRYNDELNGWIQSMNQYREGGDMAFYLQAYDGDVHIKANKGEKSSCPPLTLSLIGSIQPEIFAQSFNGDNTHNGLLDRIMVASPMGKQPKVDPFNEWKPGTTEEYDKYCLRMLEGMQKQTLEYPDELQPKAKAFYDWIKMADEKSEAGASPKWWQHFFKIVAILTVLWERDKIDADIVDYADQICRYFIGCWTRSFRDMNKSQCSKLHEKILGIIQKEKDISLNELKKKFEWKVRQDVDLVLDAMEAADLIKYDRGVAKNNKPTCTIRLVLKDVTA